MGQVELDEVEHWEGGDSYNLARARRNWELTNAALIVFAARYCRRTAATALPAKQAGP